MAKEMWDALSELFQSSSEQREMFLQEKLRSTRMQKGKSIDAFITQIQEVLNRWSIVGEVLIFKLFYVVSITLAQFQTSISNISNYN